MSVQQNATTSPSCLKTWLGSDRTTPIFRFAQKAQVAVACRPRIQQCSALRTRPSRSSSWQTHAPASHQDQGQSLNACLTSGSEATVQAFLTAIHPASGERGMWWSPVETNISNKELLHRETFSFAQALSGCQNEQCSTDTGNGGTKKTARQESPMGQVELRTKMFQPSGIRAST